jgi:HK97 family phage portal protein
MPLASLALDGVLGTGQNNDSGETVDPERGLAVPTAYRCIAIISTVVASLALEEIQKNGDAERWEVLDSLVSSTAFETMEMIAARIAGWGNYFGKKIRQNGRLIDLIAYPAGDVTVLRIKGVKTFRIRKRNDDGSLAVPNGTEPAYNDIPDGPDCPVFHIPGLGFDGLQGVSPILLAAQTFGTALAADKLAARFYSRGQQLGGILKVKAPLANQTQADAIKHQWRDSHSGIRNAGDVAILDAETDFQAITIAPEALQFLQSRQWQAWEVAKMLGIPAYMVSETTTWGTGIEQQNIGFVTYTIRGYTDRIEQRFTRDFGTRGKPLEFDLDRLMRGSTIERFQAWGQAIGWGWMTGNEARAKERMKPIPGLNKPLQPQSMNGALADGPMNTPPSPNGQVQGDKAQAPDDTKNSPKDKQNVS